MSRMDTKNRVPLSGDCEADLVCRLGDLVPRMDAVVVADQVQERNCGVVTDQLRSAVARLAREHPHVPFFADSRARIGEFAGVVAKPNEWELQRVFTAPDSVAEDTALPLEALGSMGQALSRRTGRTAFVTCAARGILVCDESVVRIPAVAVTGPTDIVGAGDSAMAGLVCGTLGGLAPPDCARLGSLVASITIQQLGTTGAASPEDLRTAAGAMETAGPG